MSVLSLADKTAVIVRRDLLTAVRYRTGGGRNNERR